MSTEAKLTEELKFLTNHRADAKDKYDFLLRDTANRIADIKAQLAEESKPKLRHGEIRLFGLGQEVGIIDLSDASQHHVIWKYGDKRNCANADGSELISTLDEVFDDLKAMQEDVTEFEMQGIRFSPVKVVSGSLGGIIIKQNGSKIHISEDIVAAFDLKIRTWQATKKRKEAKR